MFPPLNTIPILSGRAISEYLNFMTCLKGSEKSATAKGTAADGSMTSFMRSNTNFIARLEVIEVNPKQD